ncbi:MAG TPA: hypothetical protein VG247_18860 [Pseudonocardiaceae bacterium]|jgi:hypothetical protein|nr:hypothetical protein [Pseudonocardiaceae bacterium]
MTNYAHADRMHDDYPADMGRIIQIRDVDEDDYRGLAAKAAAEGLSLTAYLRRELHQLAQLPSMAEWLERATDRDWGVSGEALEQVLRERHEEDDL